MIVVDTNVLVYRFVDASDSPRRALADGVLAKAHVILPTLWRHEFLNVLVNCARNRLIAPNDVFRYWAEALATAQDAEARVDMPRALELALELGVTAYDAQFLALAEAANTILVTEDQRLRKAAGLRTKSMEQFLAEN